MKLEQFNHVRKGGYDLTIDEPSFWEQITTALKQNLHPPRIKRRKTKSYDDILCMRTTKTGTSFYLR